VGENGTIKAEPDMNSFENLMNKLAESMELASADELLEEDSGLTADAVVRGEGVRKLLLQEVANYRKNLAEEAMRQHAATISEFLKNPYRLPDDPAAQRALLQRVFTDYPQLPSSLTLQHRDFRTLSDADVESLLKQLAALGVFEDL